MSKSLEFNVFDEDLEEIVYKKQTEKKDSDQKEGAKAEDKSVKQPDDYKVYRRFGWERDGTLNVL